MAKTVVQLQFEVQDQVEEEEEEEGQCDEGGASPVGRCKEAPLDLSCDLCARFTSPCSTCDITRGQCHLEKRYRKFPGSHAGLDVEMKGAVAAALVLAPE